MTIEINDIENRAQLHRLAQRASGFHRLLRELEQTHPEALERTRADAKLMRHAAEITQRAYYGSTFDLKRAHEHELLAEVEARAQQLEQQEQENR